MRSRTRLALAAAATTTLTCAVALPAHAAPLNAPRISDPIYGSCTGIGQVEIVSPPANEHAQFTPGFVVGTHAVAVPYAFHFVLTADGQTEEVQDVAKKAVPKDAQTCDVLLGSFSDGTTYYEFTGTVTVEIQGKP